MVLAVLLLLALVVILLLRLLCLLRRMQQIRDQCRCRLLPAPLDIMAVAEAALVVAVVVEQGEIMIMIVAAVVIIVAVVQVVAITMINAEIIMVGGGTMMPTTIIAEIMIMMMAIIAGTITTLIAGEKEEKMEVVVGAEVGGRISMNLGEGGGMNYWEEGTIIQPIGVDNRSTLEMVAVRVDPVLLSREEKEEVGTRTISWKLARSHHRKKLRTTKQVSNRRWDVWMLRLALLARMME